METNKPRDYIITGIALAIALGIALYFRIALPYDRVFTADWIKYTGTDAYFYMRLVDSLLHNFPHPLTFDPFIIYPGGSQIISPPFFHVLLASIILLFTVGTPTPEIVDTIAVYFPAVLGALTVIPVYFIEKTLFNRWAGIIAALLIAILPGEFLGRSILGFTDSHVAEVLFSTTSIMFIILAIRSAWDRKIGFHGLHEIPWRNLIGPIVYSILGGIFLGLYLITWLGALLFILLLFVFFIIQSIIDHFRRKPQGYLFVINFMIFIPAILIYLTAYKSHMVLISLVIALLLPLVLAYISRIMNKINLKLIFYPVLIVVVGALVFLLIYLISPGLFKDLISALGIFTWPVNSTISEMQPILFPSNRFSLIAVWLNFTTGFIISIIALSIIIYSIIKTNQPDKTMLIVWSLVILLITLAQRRFAYYLAINVAILTGYLSWLIISFLSFRKTSNTADITAQNRTKARINKKKSKSPSESRRGIKPGIAGLIFGIIIIFFMVFFPNIGIARDTAGKAHFAVSDGWCEATDWLKNNTPDPFGVPGSYYHLFQSPQPGKTFEYPQSAYGVTAWWDYGYWILRMGNRMPISNPGTNHNGEAYIFTSQDEAEANELLKQRDSKYTIVNWDIAMVNRKFYALAIHSGNTLEDYVDIYYHEQDGSYHPVTLFYPEYYRSFIIRLYNFDGNSCEAQEPSVIKYENKLFSDGNNYKVITNWQIFDTYHEAMDYLNINNSGNYRLVGTNPFISPIPLESLKHHRHVYSSNASIEDQTSGKIAEVKIFEYTE